MAALALLERKYVKNKISSLSAAIQVAEDSASRHEEVLSHIKSVENDSEFLLEKDVEFPVGLTWFNSRPITLRGDLRGKLVVLDFFTYCCINCMHILPDLTSLEKAHSVEDGLVVVGVHSAKFLNEKVPENIANAVRRYNISHPVVNDSDIVLWNQLGITCWPTLVIISPSGHLLHYIIGEGHGPELELFVNTAIQYYRGSELTTTSIGAMSEREEGVGSGGVAPVLRYPGKVWCGGEDQGKLFVSDTGHHRVLVVERETGRVATVCGSGEPGLRDGATDEAQFQCPQGLVLNGDSLYIADTENHVIRKIDVGSGYVSTVTGTGLQGTDKEGGGRGTEQEISSPWDLAITDTNSAMLIAMAGTHQIWTHFLQDCTWTKGSQRERGVTERFTGSGEEANRNNSYPHKAGFAQPSGITLSQGGVMYVADSESSTVRAVSIKDGAVKALVGGAIDPLDLFAYGDVDGKGRDARLQHPLGVVWSEREKLLYVADSYNHKIKVVDPATKRCTTLAGSGESGLVNGSFEQAKFSEPGGLCLDSTGKTLFVADTNNHVIRVLDLEKRTVSQLTIESGVVSATGSEVDNPTKTEFKRLTGKRAQVVECLPVTVTGGGGGEVKFNIRVTLPPSTDWTSGATSAWQILPDPAVVSGSNPSRGVIEPERDISITITTVRELTAETGHCLQVELLLYFCEQSGVCHMKGALLTIPLLFSQSTPLPAENTTVHYSPELPSSS